MKLLLASGSVIVCLSILLAACGPAPAVTPVAVLPTATPTVIASATPILTPTPMPTETLTLTATITSMPTATPTTTPTKPTPTAMPTTTPAPTPPLSNRILPSEGHAIVLRGLRETNDPEQTIRLARAANANCILVTYWIQVDTSGHILPPQQAIAGPITTQADVVAQIRKYHAAGLQVWLNIRTILAPIMPGEESHEFTFELNPKLFNGLSDAAADRFLAQLEPTVLEWASMAKEEHVEIFTPTAAGQLYLVLRSDRAFAWVNSLLPMVREMYDGALVQKIDLNPTTQQLSDGDLSVYSFEGWDYVSTDVFGSNGISGEPVRTYEQWTTFVRQLLGIAGSADEKYGTKGIILGPEIMLPESGPWALQAGTDFWGHGDLTPKEMERAKVRLWDILFQETVGQVKGYVFWGWAPGEEIVLLGLEKENGGERYISRAPAGYQEIGPMELIAGYYELSEQNLQEYIEVRRKQLVAEHREEALAAIGAVETWLDQQGTAESGKPHVESIRKKLDEAVALVEAGEYLQARRLADQTYALTLEMNPLGLLLDGEGEDWVSYPAIATDPAGDTPPERDLQAFYVVNDDQYLYLMVRLSTVNPASDLIMHLDTNGDGQGDYHIRASSSGLAQLFRSFSQGHHEPFGAVECAYGQVIELRIPLESVGDPQSVSFEIASWDESQGDIADDFGDFGWNEWITYHK